MSNQRFSALVVDDEPALRRLTVAALSHFNFSCEEAADGEQASSLVARSRYDVVITDLRMPKRNGHALAVELLSSGQERPLVVVLTGVIEPRLAQDLFARGVDEVEFKPVNFSLFGAKIRALCERNRREPLRPAGLVDPAAATEFVGKVTTQQVAERIEVLTETLPVSRVAVEVVNLINDEDTHSDVVARCIARDPGLSVELLKFANSAYYNAAGQRIDDLQSAILRLGHRKISELALGSTTLHALTKSALPWIDADVVWRRCLAAGQAIENLNPIAELGGEDEGLYLSAMLIPMSRVLVGLAFPEMYQRLIERCHDGQISLDSLERQTLPLAPEAILAEFLARAGLSPRLYKPLKIAATPYAEIAHLADPLRTKVEHLRIATLAGRLAAGGWASWDEVDFPPAALLRNARVDALGPIINQVRRDLAGLPSNSSPSQCAAGTNHDFAGALAGKSIRYFRLAAEPDDFLAILLKSLGMQLVRVFCADACKAEPVLVNCLNVSEERLARFWDECQSCSTRILVGNDERRPANSTLGSYIALPCGFGHLIRHLRAAVTPHASVV